MRSYDESGLLDEVLGIKDTWKGVDLWYCELCRTFSIGCPSKCGGSSCNAGGCPDCLEIHKDFDKAKTSIADYLSDEEIKVFEKIHYLKKYMGESLAKNEYEINWTRLKKEGKLCDFSKKLFEKEIKRHQEKSKISYCLDKDVS